MISTRPFEICGSKTLCLCEYVEGLETYYDINKEIITFNTKDELEYLISHYLSSIAEREAIAQAGYDRTMRDHKWGNRFEEIFSKISAE